jgi:hypothetical protein
VPTIHITIEIEREKGELVFIPFNARRGEPFGAFARVAALYGNRYLLLLFNAVQCCSRVAVRLLYKVYNENTSNSL